MPLRNVVIVFLSAAVSLVCYTRAERDRDAAIIYEALNVIDKDYYEPVERRRLFEGALQGMVDQLDEHSAYIAPEEFEPLQETLGQEFGGIGIAVELNPETNRLTVLSPLVGTPAHAAGMRAGDVILEIDGQDTQDMTLKDAVALMRGKKGEPVQLLVQHMGDEKPTSFRIVRDIIPIDSVLGDTRRPDGRWNYYLEDYPDIGYIRLTTFGERTAQELKEALDAVRDKMTGLILDLRGNAGGLLQTAVDVSDLFIAKGRIVSTVGRGNIEKTKYDATPDVVLDEVLPLVVLTNRYSASASEIVAACLQDHKRAVIVGERTWGKGTVQNIIKMEGGKSALKLTTASYWRPNGKNIHRRKGASEKDEWGIRPDKGFEVQLTDEQFENVGKHRRERDFLYVGRSGSRPSSANSENGNADGETSVDQFQDLQILRAVEYLQQQNAVRSIASQRA